MELADNSLVISFSCNYSKEISESLALIASIMGF